MPEVSLTEIESADIARLVDASAADLLAELNRVQARRQLVPAVAFCLALLGLVLAAGGAPGWAFALAGLAGLAGLLWARHLDVTCGTAILQQTVTQRLRGHGVPMAKFAQSTPNLTEASTNLYDLVKGRSLVVYTDVALWLKVSRAVAAEFSRDWRITKDKASHKIDVAVASPRRRRLPYRREPPPARDMANSNLERG